MRRAAQFAAGGALSMPVPCPEGADGLRVPEPAPVTLVAAVAAITVGAVEPPTASGLTGTPVGTLPSLTRAPTGGSSAVVAVLAGAIHAAPACPGEPGR